MRPIKVLIADSHTIFREGLRSLLRNVSGIRIIGEASTCGEAAALTQKLHPSILVIDIAMPDQNGLEASFRILSQNPGVKVIILSMYDDQALVTQAMKGGIQGYLIKQAASKEFIAALRAVARGHAYFSTSMNKFILAMNEDRNPLLTRRETQVLQQIARGTSNREISTALSISIKTVQKHRQQIMDKLGIHDVAGLTRFAVRKGLI